MNAFDVKCKKQFAGFDTFGRAEITADRKLAQLIDSEWHYSWHWPEGIDSDWLAQVRRDLDAEKKFLSDRKKQLDLAEKILSEIEL